MRLKFQLQLLQGNGSELVLAIFTNNNHFRFPLSFIILINVTIIYTLWKSQDIRDRSRDSNMP